MIRFWLTLCLVFVVGFATAQRMMIDRVLATIGGEIVLLSEVEEQNALMKDQGGPVPDDAKCYILEQLLANKLMINQAKLDSIIIGDEEVEAQLNARIEQILGYMNGDEKQFEAYYGQPVNEVKEQFRQDLKEKLMVDRMRGQIMADVAVTPSEVKEFFAKIPIDSLPYFNSEVELGEIVGVPVVNKEEEQKVIDQLNELRQMVIDSIETFEDLAARYGQDGTRQVGGDLGWSVRGKFVQEFEAAAYKLSVGEISEPVETPFGYHLIQMIGRRGNSIRVRHILIRPEITDADLDLTRNFLDSVRQVLATDSTLTFSYAVKRFSDEEQESYNNDGRMVNPATGNTFFEVGDLDPDIFFAQDTLEIDEISRPFEFRTRDGKTLFRMVKLQSRTRPHTANLAQDYSKVRQAAIESKRNEYINNWIDGRVSQTFIQINASQASCPNLQNWIQDRTVIKP
ncbi:MAG: peptidylprolyl isomerase [Bacteroidota bacterium]